MERFTGPRLLCGVCSVATPSCGVVSIRFQEPIRSLPIVPLRSFVSSLNSMRLSLRERRTRGRVQSWLQEIRDSAQMTPAIYHKAVDTGAAGAGCRKIVRSTGILFGRNTQS
jgi:hypothetical protein